MSEPPQSLTNRIVSAIPTPMVDRTMKQLGTFCEFKYGRSLPERDRREGVFPVYGSNGILGWHDEPITSGPTIIIGRKGSAGALHYSDRACFPIDTTYYVDRSCTTVDLRWLFFMLQMLVLDALNKHAAVPGLNRNDAYEKELTVPSSYDQKRIAAVLDKADFLRRQRLESIQLAERLLQALFIDMFGNPVTNPMCWPTQALGEFGIVQTGNTPPRSQKANYAATGLEWIKTDNILEDEVYVTPAAERLSELGAESARVAPSGSLLVACIAGSEKSIGRAALTNRLVAFNQQINAITPHAGVSSLFLYFLMKVGRRHVQSAAGKGMKKIINKTTFEGLRFIAPGEDEQQRFAVAAERLIKQSQLCREQSLQLDGLFLSIQQRAFRGELDLSRIGLDSQAEIPTASDSDLSASQSARPEGIAFLIAPRAMEGELERLATLIRKDGPMPWSADYFKYRVLGTMPTPFSFDDLMQRARGYFEGEPHYEEIKDIMLELLGQGESPTILRQRFDLTINEGTNEIFGSKQIVFESVS